ncbi:MAG: hypothetical protein JO186_00615 [Actinobacteria bacterium]|nr:hypothetical protein [Actinomycetota bacterium]MBV8396448.1 hypothetical protein [Actinomycetota bacterium]MBV8599162.1 hypothetical protein [Actinomycetota bacterium]
MTDRFNRTLTSLWLRLQKDEGQTITEYALVLVLVAGIFAAIAVTVEGSIKTWITSILSSFPV